MRHHATEKVDCLLVHVPKWQAAYPLFGDFMFGMTIPVGLFSIADWLNRSSVSTRIMHMGIEAIHGRSRLHSYIEEHAIEVVGLSLHWQHQSYDVIECAKKIKEKHPCVSVVLGGLMASAFAREILEEYPFIDAVIRGEGEVPLLQFYQERKKREWRAVLNLVWRSGSTIVDNGVQWVPTEEDLDLFCYTQFSDMIDFETYRKCATNTFYLKSVPRFINRVLLGTTFYVPILLGKGCLYHCSYCSGSGMADLQVSGRTTFCLRSPQSVLTSIRDVVQKYGCTSVYMEGIKVHDDEKKRNYYVQLFHAIRREFPGLSCRFTSHEIVDDQFLKLFSQTFTDKKKSGISLTVDSHDENVRAINRSPAYSNEELKIFLKRAREYAINVCLFFSCGLPREKYNSEYIRAQRLFLNSLRIIYPKVRFVFSVIDIDPMSPASMRPDLYDLFLTRRTFIDYYGVHQKGTTCASHSLGYSGLSHFCGDRDVFEKTISRTKCAAGCTLEYSLMCLNIFLPHCVCIGICFCMKLFWNVYHFFWSWKRDERFTY